MTYGLCAECETQTSAVILWLMLRRHILLVMNSIGCSSTNQRVRKAVCGNSLGEYETERRNHGKLKFHYKMLITWRLLMYGIYFDILSEVRNVVRYLHYYTDVSWEKKE